MNEDETNLGLRVLMNQNSLNNCWTFLPLPGLDCRMNKRLEKDSY